MITNDLYRCYQEDPIPQIYYQILGHDKNGNVQDFGLYEELEHAHYVRCQLKEEFVLQNTFFQITKLVLGKTAYFEQLGLMEKREE